MRVIDTILIAKKYALTGDFCTGSPESIFGHDLFVACAVHDAQYSKDPTEKQIQMIMEAMQYIAKTREEADIQFRDFIEHKSNRTISTIMYYIVRVLGNSYWRK